MLARLIHHAPRRLPFAARALLLATLTALACSLPATSAEAAPSPFAARQQVIALGNGGAQGQLARANLNNDQYDDFFVVYGTPGAATGTVGSYFFRAFIGSATGYATTLNLTAGADVTQPRLVAAADLNGDGRDEAIHTQVIFGTTIVAFARFNANGSYNSSQSGGASFSGAATSLVSGDFIVGDAGADEVAVRTATGNVLVYDYNGSVYALATSFAAQAGTMGALDYDTTASPGDGIDDIVVGSSAGTSDLAVYRSDGVGGFTLAGSLARNSDAPSAGIARASFDGSGGNDFAVAGTSPVVSGYASEGGAYASGETGVAAGSSALTTPVVGDFDADGFDDYAVFTSALTIFSRPAAASSFLPTATRTIATGGYDVVSAASFSFNNDGRDDLLVYGSDGNISVYRSDATPPLTTITATPPAATNSTSASFTFSANETATFECRLDSTNDVDWSACTSPRAYSALPAGSHTFEVRATDTAGNLETAPESYTWTIDLTPPMAPVTTTPANGAATNDATPTYSGTAESGSTVTVVIDGSPAGTTTADGSGNWTFTQPIDLAAGAHGVRARATDAAGNTSPDSNTNSFSVDATAPAAPTLNTPANGSATNDDTPLYAGAAESGSTVTVIVDGAPIGTSTAASSGNWSLAQTAALSQGAHSVRATATDAAGNTSAVSSTNTFTVDTTAPGAPTVVTPANNSTTADPTPTIAGLAEANSTVAVYFDGSPVATTTTSGAGNWSYAPSTPLSDGAHTASATASDAVGNTSGASPTRTFTVDSTAPAAPIVYTPVDGSTTADATPLVSGHADTDAILSVYVDGVLVATASTTGSGDFFYTPTTALPEGTHTVRVSASDVSGNGPTDSNTSSFSVDTVAPDAPTATTAPGDRSRYTTFAFSGDADTVSFECRVDSASANAWVACASPFEPALADGPHTVDIHAIDDAGNRSAAYTRTWTLDTTNPPAPTVTSGPDPSSTQTSATFVFSDEPGATFECRIDGGPWTACTSAKTYEGLAIGAHEFEVRATDSAGNVGTTRTVRFTVSAPAETPAQAMSFSLAVAATTSIEEGAVPVGCVLDAGQIARCTVRTFVGNTRVGTGTKILSAQAGRASTTVRVKLNRRGLRLVRRVGGVRLVFRGVVATNTGKEFSAGAQSRVLPLTASAVPTDGLFASIKRSLTKSGRAYVRGIAANLDGAKRVTCVGHTDSIGSRPSNTALGLRRAKTVCAALRRFGVDARLLTRSAGETQSRASNTLAKGRALNRRVELVVRYG